MNARLYGRMHGWSSHAQVSRGFDLVLRETGLLAGVYPVDETADLDDEPHPGAGARSGIFTGPPSMVIKMTQGSAHKARYGMLAPNSTVVELPMLKAYAAACTHVLTPSLWATGILTPKFDVPVLTAPHGVRDEFCPATEREGFAARQPPAEGFLVLHLSTSCKGRKGTFELLEAWRLLLDEKAIPEQSLLTLVLDNLAMRSLEIWLEANARELPPRVNLMRRMGLGRGGSPEVMRGLYSAYHVVCQPSRGEAFGCVPLEARACGVPVVATNCTGHSEHMRGVGEADGVVVVPSGDLGPLDDLPGAEAPKLSVQAVACALEKAYLGWSELDMAARRKAGSVRRAWSWQVQLAPLMRRLKEAEGVVTKSR